MSFFYLLLGHLLGDFTLQTNRIARHKTESWQWNALHAGIVTLCMFLLSIPFGWGVLGLVLLNGLFHFYIDYYKPRISLKLPMPGLVYFLLDQAVHILLIYGISRLARHPSQFLLIHKEIVVILLVLIFITSFSAVLNEFVLGTLFPKANKRFFEQGEKRIGNMTRLFTTFGLYLGYVYSPLFLILIVFVLGRMSYQFYTHWHTWMSVRYLAVKLALDMVISVSGLVLLLNAGY